MAVGVIVFGGMVGPLLLMLGLSRTSASTGSLLLNLEGWRRWGLVSRHRCRRAGRRCAAAHPSHPRTWSPGDRALPVAAQLGVRAHHWRFGDMPGGRHSRGRSFEYRHLRPAASTRQRHRLKTQRLRSRRRSSWALMATMTVLADINTAPSAGASTMPAQ